MLEGAPCWEEVSRSLFISYIKSLHKRSLSLSLWLVFIVHHKALASLVKRSQWKQNNRLEEAMRHEGDIDCRLLLSPLLRDKLFYRSFALLVHWLANLSLQLAESSQTQMHRKTHVHVQTRTHRHAHASHPCSINKTNMKRANPFQTFKFC